MFDAAKTTAALIAWLRTYFAENAAPGTVAVIGVSGGKDSSVAAALCAAALGEDRVVGVRMPQGEQSDIEVAYDLCRTLDIRHVEINIGPTTDSLIRAIHHSGLEPNKAAIINTPARIRMAALYAVAAICGGRVVNTGNLSENHVGYSTKYGDGAGDFSPFANLTATEVKAIGRELGLAAHFIDKPPADGLTGLTDEDNLGFTYETLDRYIRTGLCDDAAAKEKIDRLHAINQHKLQLMPAFQF